MRDAGASGTSQVPCAVVGRQKGPSYRDADDVGVGTAREKYCCRRRCYYYCRSGIGTDGEVVRVVGSGVRRRM